jgi:FKBP-type peptidyl-prolyl cis-trans isomerase
VRKLLSILLPAALLLTACGGSGDGNGGSGSDGLDDITVTAGDEGAAPTVDFAAPLELAESTAEVISEGEGEGAAEGQWVRYRLLAKDAVTGEQLGETYTGLADQTVELSDGFEAADPALYEALLGANPGSQVAYYVQPPEATSSSAPAQNPQLLFLTVQDVKDKAVKAEAAEVAELEEAGKLPEITFNDDGVPSVKIPEGNDAPDNLIVQVLEEGDGKEATESSTVKAHYAGWNWVQGTEFDSSYSRGEATEFPLNGVIEGWTKGLTGLKEGAKVMLSIPTEMAYVQAQGEAAGDLIFYVELTEVQ